MDITQATEQDFEAVSELFRGLDAHHARLLPERVKAAAELPRSRAEFIAYITGDEKVMLLARDADAVIGFANLAIYEIAETASRVGRKFAHLDNLYVVPEYRRAGVATTLIRESKHWCAQRGVTKMELQVYNANNTALALYESLGFQPYLTRMELETGA
jgi:ribosomal protein S18 acetylase RimI-like enzyme